jgi:hypothetical protein
MEPIWGDGYFGVRWRDNYVWFQEMGVRPFLMTHLQGKTIPMWVPDPDGKLRAKNPKIKVRNLNGTTQVLIFRKVAHKGERKLVTRRVGGVERQVSVPRSYPGAPGRINPGQRHEGRPVSKRGGQIKAGHGGVRWRYPGLKAQMFLHQGLLMAAKFNGVEPGKIVAAHSVDSIKHPGAMSLARMAW